jgi:hypothetical protein
LRKLSNVDLQTATAIALIIICSYFLIRYIIFIVSWINFPAQLDFGESPNMYVAQLWANGQWKWDISVFPYFTSVYPPVFFIITSLFIKIFGFSLVIGRIIEVVSYVGSMFILYLIAREFLKNKWLAIAIGMLPLSVCIIRDWSIMAKNDMLAIFFELIGILFVVKYKKSNWFYVSILFFTLAFFTKQNIAAGAIATCIYLIFTQLERGIKYSLLMGASIIVQIVIGNFFTDNEFYKHIFIYTATTPYFQSWQTILKMIIVSYVPFIVSFCLSVWYIWKFKKQLSYPAVFFIVVLLVDIVLIGHKGGFVNYQIEIAFASFIMLSLIIPLILTHYKSFIIAGMLVPSVLIFGNFNDAVHMPLKSNYLPSYDKVVSFIQSTDKPVYSENIGVVLKANKQPYTEPFVFANLTMLGKWNKQILINDLEKGNIEYVVLERPIKDYQNERTLPIAQDTISDNYKLIYSNIDKNSPEYYDYNLFVYKYNK